METIYSRTFNECMIEIRAGGWKLPLKFARMSEGTKCRDRSEMARGISNHPETDQ